LDAALGHCTTWCSRPDHVRMCVTIGMTTSFLAAVKGGTITAIGQLEGVHDRVATARGKILDADGNLLGAAQGSFRYPSGSEFVEGVPRKTNKG
jgi:acyl-coenzyme A thioesterase PaaI-like protein